MKEWKRKWKLDLIENVNPNGRIFIMRLFDWISAFAGMTKKIGGTPGYCTLDKREFCGKITDRRWKESEKDKSQ